MGGISKLLVHIYEDREMILNGEATFALYSSLLLLLVLSFLLALAAVLNIIQCINGKQNSNKPNLPNPKDK